MRPDGRRNLCVGLMVAAVACLPESAWAQKQVVRLLLDAPLLEAPPDEFDMSALFGGPKPTTLHEMVKMIREAARDGEVAGLVMVIEQPSMGLAQAEELTRALRDFRAKGKKVYCYMDEAGNLGTALAAAADHVTLAEHSTLGVMGIHAEVSFYKGLLDKIAVEADLLHCGDYKSALEPFTRTEPSKESAEQINWLLDGIYDRFVRLIAEGRKLSEQQVKAAIDNAPLQAEEALERKLVDAVSSFPAFKQLIHKEFGKDVELVKDYGRKKPFELDFSNPFTMLNQLFSDLMPKGDRDGKAAIALIYIDGAIMVAKEEPGLFGDAGVAGSTTIRAAFEKAREDDNVKAVVVRVDSPGGSALASDIMWEAATRLSREKPLIVSMGNVAGSGGYYVSIPGDTIFAEETTITGSIGVVGGKFVWKGLFEDKLGITTTEFERGKNAGWLSPNRPWSEAERARMLKYITTVYEQFKARVRSSRGDRLKGELEQLAGGRVYTGKQALERGLVDKIGGLHDAIAFAAEKAAVKDYEITVLPKRKELADLFKMLMGEPTEDEWEIALGSRPMANDRNGLALRRLLAGALFAGHLARSAGLDLADPSSEPLGRLADGLWRVMILDREHVGCFMPFDLRFR